jgi:hypothetical protein
MRRMLTAGEPNRWLKTLMVGLGMTVAGFGLSGCTASPPPATAPTLAQGQAPSGAGGRTGPTASLGRFVIPLPRGDWQQAYSGERELAHGTSARTIMVGEVDGVIDRLVLVYHAKVGSREYFLPRENCANPEYFFATTGVQQPGTGECWHVRTVNLGLAGDPHWVNKIVDLYARGVDLYSPATMIGVRFIRHDGADLLQVDYLWNPDLLFPRPDGDVWLPADWSNQAIAEDPRKKVIMETLRRWGEDWQPRMAAAFPF